MAYNNNNNRGGYKSGNGSDNKQAKVRADVKKEFYNPYSFVPFAESVYQLSDKEVKELDTIHDIPVQGSLSGRIKVDFEAVTPFCVLSSKKTPMAVNGQYFVPGTSLKGMIRSVFEILTYANARNGIANNRHSMRDVHSSDYELKDEKTGSKSGFLIKLNGQYYIQPCHSSPWKYKDIEVETQKFGLRNKHSVKDKYALIKAVMKKNGKSTMWFFSGFMNNKKHEFLFDVPNFSKNELIPIEKDVWNDFIFIHEKENANENWKYWRNRLRNFNSVNDIKPDGIAPCFFRVKENHTVKDLGFSYLYRQPYSKKTHEFLPKEHQEAKGIDLAQAVFGYVDGSKALKGRVQFGNALVPNARTLSEQSFILGSPKPTYYPFYLEQEAGSGKLNTYFQNSRLSGAKRYLLQDTAQTHTDIQRNSNSKFVPLDKGAKFTSYVYFHNLHDYELGALLAAITFCQKPECHHSLGYAKPFGYGRMKVTACDVMDCENADITTLVEAFISKLTEQCAVTKEKWESSVNKLFVLAHGNVSGRVIRYPRLGNKEKDIPNEFEGVKNKNYSLNDFDPTFG